MDIPGTLDLVDYRRQVADLYAAVRAGGAGERTWEAWRRTRDRLFRVHPSSPYAAGHRPESLPYFDYDPTLVTTGEVVPVEDELSFDIAHSADGSTRARRFASVRFSLGGSAHELNLFWLDQYGGGLFLPFRDETSNDTTYGGGRYLLDTAKSADLGSADGGLVLDFNFAYHPSCFHDARWSCPLAPPENRLDVAITAGERSDRE